MTAAGRDERERPAPEPTDAPQDDAPDAVEQADIESFPASDAPGLGSDPIPGEPRRPERDEER